MQTQTIAGHKVTLEDGNWYIATRPMLKSQTDLANAKRGRKVFPVHIHSSIESDTPALTIAKLSYDEANDFINEFNNGKTSFDGRCW